jgi:minor extracellular serine protease Vpr
MGEQILELKSLSGSLENIEVFFEGPEFIQFSNVLDGNKLQIRWNAIENNFGDYEGKIFLNQNDDDYKIPFLIHFTEGAVSVSQEKGNLSFGISYPEIWTFAKILVINSKDGSRDTASITPTKNETIKVYENGEYWIESKIIVDGKSYDAFNKIEVNSVVPGTSKPFELFDFPEKQIGIILVIMLIVGIIGLKITRKQKSIQV